MSEVLERAWAAEPHEVQAILAGRQVQFRRPVEGVRLFGEEYDRRWYPHASPPSSLTLDWSWWEGPPHGPSCYHFAVCPWGKPGDRLRVAHDAGPLLLEVESVRVERLHDMKDKDALKEGVEVVGGGRYALGTPGLQPQGSMLDAYRTLHAHQYGPERWALNEWYWIVTFRVVEPVDKSAADLSWSRVAEEPDGTQVYGPYNS